MQGRLEGVHDLHAADAVYHRNCHSRFVQNLPRHKAEVKRGRPVQVDCMEAFNKLCKKLEMEGENELYTVRELQDMMLNMCNSDSDLTQDEKIYSRTYFRELLMQRYQDSVYFASYPGREDVVGFRNMCNFIIRTKFISEQGESDETPAEKLVSQAAAMILAEIRETEYERLFYPTAEDIAGDGLRFLPPLLKTFLQGLIKDELKQAGLGQGIVQAAKPRSCIMPLIFGVGMEMDKLGNRHMQDKLHHLGFSVSYSETTRFKHSVLKMEPIIETVGTNEPGLFTQFVADNFDHNIRTLDGHGSFHGMGIISTTLCPTGSFGCMSHRVRRRELMTAAETATTRAVKIVQFEQYQGSSALRNLQLHSINSLKRPIVLPVTLNLTNLWHCGGMVSPTNHPRPNWSGYMQTVCTGNHPGVSTVEMLALIGLNPSDENCIYSTLLFVMEQAKAMKVPTACITFDQPLYIKAVDIAMQANLDIVIRLGGFHTLMSFLGSIGHLMKGSGLEEILGEIYGPNTIEHVLSGKAYDRAVRGHFLVQAALIDMLLDYLKTPMQAEPDDAPVIVGDHCVAQQLAGSLSDFDLTALDVLYEQTVHDGVNTDDTTVLQSDALVYALSQLEVLKCSLSAQSRTARLWLLYVKYVSMLRTFITAERTGNWLLHLDTVTNMLPLFAATGHANYAKSARVYVQQMRELSTTHPWLHDQFMAGLVNPRRSDRVWAALSTDLVIEQTMMKDGKTPGGLTRGRGMTESVRSTWIGSVAECTSIHTAMSHVTKVDVRMEQHVEVGRARMNRDMVDLNKIKGYLLRYSPFRYLDTDRLISLSSGLAGQGDAINCDEADSVGSLVHKNWDNERYCAIKLQKPDKIITLAHLIQSVTGKQAKVSMDPNCLFTRLIMLAYQNNRVREFFNFELTPYPMALYKDSLMRKPDKPTLYKGFITGLTEAKLPPDMTYVVDGGYLLHKVRWTAPTDISNIMPLFTTFLTNLRKLGCSDVHVVFDGYDCGPSIKDTEHLRRSGKATTVAPTQLVTTTTKQIGQQEAFLANKHNKMAFIDVLSSHLQQAGINTHQAQGDADTDIVAVALQCASRGNVVVLAEDTDILVLLLHHRTSSMYEINFESRPKKGRGGKQVGGKNIAIGPVQHRILPAMCEMLPVVHAFGGCDSTSSIFGIGKGKIFKQVQGDKTLHVHCRTLQAETASATDVCTAGLGLMLAVQGGCSSDSLGGLRYARYCNMTVSKRFQLEKLPPSEGSARMHAMRVHFQAVFWCKLGQTCLKPTDWGWRQQGNIFVPIQVDGEIAPEHMLPLVSGCACKTKCSSALCTCRKNGLPCVAACKHCRGTDCTNAQPHIANDVHDDTDSSDVQDVAASVATDAFTDELPDFLWDDDSYMQNFLFDEVV